MLSGLEQKRFQRHFKRPKEVQFLFVMNLTFSFSYNSLINFTGYTTETTEAWNYKNDIKESKF